MLFGKHAHKWSSSSETTGSTQLFSLVPHFPTCRCCLCWCYQRLGMTVGRTWAFNSAMPDSDGHYYEKQVREGRVQGRGGAA